MYKKLLCAIALPVVLISSSCGKDSTTYVNLPLSSVSTTKDSGFVSITGNAYPSVGMLAREPDNYGRNHVIEMDNPLKYNINGKISTYYSFNVEVKSTKTPTFFEVVRDNGLKLNPLQVTEPGNADLATMSQESLRYTGDKTGPAIFSSEVAQKLFQYGVVYWQDTSSQTQSQTKYTFLIESSLIQPFKMKSRRFELHIKLRTNENFDDWIELVRSPIHVAVIGDSVMWGQGLAKDEKFLTKIVKQIGDTKGQIVRVDNYARSGAIFGADNNTDGIDLDGEIAHPSPTINAQFKRVLTDYRPLENEIRVERQIDPKRIDLLVMDGGINNVGSSTVFFGFNPTTLRTSDIGANNSDSVTQPKPTVSNIAKKVIEVITSQDSGHKKFKNMINQAFCYNETRNDFSGCTTKDNNIALLLHTARKNLPNAQIDIMGYFPLLSENSKISCNSSVTLTNPANNKPVTVNMGSNGILGYSAYMAAMPSLGSLNALLVSGAVSAAGTLVSATLKDNVVERSYVWTNQSNRIISRAVDLVNNNVKNEGRGLLRFIPISQKFVNKTSFSNDAYLWGIAQGKCQKDGELFPPEDSVWKERKAICEGLPKNSFQMFLCARMSFFHPNVKGVDNVYVPEIMTSLKNSGFMGRTDL